MWPVSRDNYPKQFINIKGDKSLFQENVEQLLEKYKPEDIYVSTSDKYIKYVTRQAPMIPKENLLVEPHIKKATGPAATFSMIHMMNKHPDEVVMFYVQPVIIREPTEKYLEMIEGIEKIVKKHNKLVTGGKFPKYPEIGSDYLELGEKVDTETNLEVYQSIRFVERPKTIKECEELLKEHKLSLHCNHLTWTPKKYFEALKLYRPDWYEVSQELSEAIKTNADAKKILEIYSKFEPGNVELFTNNLYNKGEVQVVILPFEWTHITTWNDIYEYYNRAGIESKQGLVRTLGTKNNLVLNKTNSLIGLIDVEDLIVIQTEESLLICPKNSSGKLRELLKQIEDDGLIQYL